MVMGKSQETKGEKLMYQKITVSIQSIAAHLAAWLGSVDAMAWLGVLFIVASLVLAGQGR